MIDLSNFRIWLMESKEYSDRTISNTVSRLKRADGLLPWFDDPVYIFRLEQLNSYKELTATVKSQIKKSVKLYFEYLEATTLKKKNCSTTGLRVLSLFANIGVAEAYLDSIGVDVVIANELIERRAILYSKIYPHTKVICGDITNKELFERIIKESITSDVNVIMATPPCQGMSTAGQQNEDDERNQLICPVVESIKRIKPKYVFIENVPLFYQTQILIKGEKVLIPDYIVKELGRNYIINRYVINTENYSVPQTSERAIMLLTRKDVINPWTLPQKDDNIVTMQEAIGNLPIIDPYITDVTEEELLKIFPHYYERREKALSISPWNEPPQHIKRQVIAMQHTPTGCTAFDNVKYFPTKEDGKAVKGYHNTYKRQNWDTAAYTVTMDNRKISSQNNVHPGRKEYIDDEGCQIYSDPRALTLYELMIIMSLPKDWPVPLDTPEAFLRRIIGEGIPPLFVKKAFENLIREMK